jgi:hypothetical protein
VINPPLLPLPSPSFPLPPRHKATVNSPSFSLSSTSPKRPGRRRPRRSRPTPVR